MRSATGGVLIRARKDPPSTLPDEDYECRGEDRSRKKKEGSGLVGQVKCPRMWVSWVIKGGHVGIRDVARRLTQ